MAGARSRGLSGAFLGGDFATRGAWSTARCWTSALICSTCWTRRSAHRAGAQRGDPRRWVELTCEHEGGAVSQCSLSGSVNVPEGGTHIELFGSEPPLVYDTTGLDYEDAWPVLRREFATAVRTGVSGELDARRGLRLQELIAQAARG